MQFLTAIEPFVKIGKELQQSFYRKLTYLRPHLQRWVCSNETAAAFLESAHCKQLSRDNYRTLVHIIPLLEQMRSNIFLDNKVDLELPSSQQLDLGIVSFLKNYQTTLLWINCCAKGTLQHAVNFYLNYRYFIDIHYKSYFLPSEIVQSEALNRARGILQVLTLPQVEYYLSFFYTNGPVAPEVLVDNFESYEWVLILAYQNGFSADKIKFMFDYWQLIKNDIVAFMFLLKQSLILDPKLVAVAAELVKYQDALAFLNNHGIDFISVLVAVGLRVNNLTRELKVFLNNTMTDGYNLLRIHLQMANKYDFCDIIKCSFSWLNALQSIIVDEQNSPFKLVIQKLITHIILSTKGYSKVFFALIYGDLEQYPNLAPLVEFLLPDEKKQPEQIVKSPDKQAVRFFSPPAAANNEKQELGRSFQRSMREF